MRKSGKNKQSEGYGKLHWIYVWGYAMRIQTVGEALSQPHNAGIKRMQYLPDFLDTVTILESRENFKENTQNFKYLCRMT